MQESLGPLMSSHSSSARSGLKEFPLIFWGCFLEQAIKHRGLTSLPYKIPKTSSLVASINTFKHFQNKSLNTSPLEVPASAKTGRERDSIGAALIRPEALRQRTWKGWNPGERNSDNFIFSFWNILNSGIKPSKFFGDWHIFECTGLDQSLCRLGR